MEAPKRIPRGSKRRPRKEFPYYKVQLLEQGLAAWMDLPRATESLEDARQTATAESMTRDARIMEILSGRKRKPIETYRNGSRVS